MNPEARPPFRRAGPRGGPPGGLAGAGETEVVELFYFSRGKGATKHSNVINFSVEK